MKLLIADDHPVFRKGLKDILESSFEGVSIIECNNGREAIENIRAYQPEIAILDINMPEYNGLEVSALILKENLSSRVVILTMYKEKEMIRKAMLSGAYGYLLKDFAVDDIIECINTVKEKGKYIGPALQPFYNEVVEEDSKKKVLMNSLKNLNQGELKTLKLVSQNKTTKEIAELLFLSEKTIENYRSRICQKLDLPPRNNSLILWINENRELLFAFSEF